MVLQFNSKCKFVSKSSYRHYLIFISPHLKNFTQLKKFSWDKVDLLGYSWLIGKDPDEKTPRALEEKGVT